MTSEICPACGAASDGWPLDLCQDCWEAYTSATFFETEAGLLRKLAHQDGGAA